MFSLIALIADHTPEWVGRRNPQAQAGIVKVVASAGFEVLASPLPSPPTHPASEALLEDRTLLSPR